MVKRALGLILNFLSIVCVAMVIWNFVHKPDRKNLTSPADIRVGSRLALSGVSWADAPHSVVLAVSTNCPYCRSSAGLYKNLIYSAAKTKNFQLAAVLPEPLDAVKSSLPALGIDGLSNIQTASYSTLGLSATPTLLIVNRRAMVEAVWTGKLNGAQEAEVFAKLGVDVPAAKQLVTPNDGGGPTYVAPQGVRPLLNDRHTILLDPRERLTFDQAHIHGALNIPFDELSARAIHELPQDGTLLIYCGSYQRSGCLARGEDLAGMPTFCNMIQRILERKGFFNVRLIAADLASLPGQGVPVVGTICK
jgi:hypothetical protein